ncbi:MAG: uroporphyrinogen-III C-methyltransferase [Deltaproteobacteria bacterium]|nr:uroporphyrinogen-III C-methyltransferase [Deltaproteobacteria bacterium]
MAKGKVYIIGAGPGDPGLITVKGVRCLQEADVIVYDHLVGEELLFHRKPSARLVYAGKRGGNHTLSQDETNALLVEEASRGCIVARLKGGDPFLFGRGGEEAEVLAKAGIPFEVVPGVTSAVSVPAYAGIPLTYRGYTSTIALVTGHEDPAKGRSDIDWQSLAGMGTIVFLMGVRNLPQITENLIRHGKNGQTPAALIRWGSTADQTTLTADLGDIARLAEERGMLPPSLLVVGSVVNLRNLLNWFETKPLFGRGVVITRPDEQSVELSALLWSKGARVIHFPTIKIEPPASWSALDDAIERLEAFDWLVFTSANGIHFFFRRMKDLGRDIRDLKGLRLCTIGPATADALGRLGLPVDLLPDAYISEGVVEAFAGEDICGKRILVPRAEKARDVIPEGLGARGALVEIVAAYRTVNSGRSRVELETLYEAGKIDVITLTSPSTVQNLVEIMGPDHPLFGNVKIACIGPVTAAAARKAGLAIDILPDRYTIPDLVDALVRYYNRIEDSVA